MILFQMAHDTTGVAYGKAVGRNGFRYDAAGTDDTVFADGYAGQQNCTAADPDVVFDSYGFGIIVEKGMTAVRRPVGQKSCSDIYGMSGGVNLHIRGNQYIIADGYFIAVDESAVDIDDDIAADFCIDAVIAVKRLVYFYISAYLAEQLL